MLFGHDEGKNIKQLCDGTKDVVCIKMGGTGGASLAEAQNNLGIKANSDRIDNVESTLATKATKEEVNVQKLRIDQFTSLAEGSTTGDAELQDIRIGADGTIYNSAGDAVRGQVDDLKSELTEYNAYNILAMIGNFINGTFGGVEYTWNEEHTMCTLNGTASGLSVNRIVNQAGSIAPFENGKSYYFDVNCSDANVSLHLFYYYDGTLNSTPIYIQSPTLVTIPSDATGIMLRLGCTSGITYENVVITVAIHSAFTNERLTEMVSDTLFPTGDSSDRRNDIIANINKYGYCKLAGGEFYIGTIIDLPSNCSIIGEGKNTIIRKRPSSGNGMFRVKDSTQNVTFKNLTFKGSLTSKPAEHVDTGNTAILLSGNASYVTVENCAFYGIERSGIYCESGYNWLRSVDVINCNFLYCNNGIELVANGEFANVTNCHFNSCYYGVINTGGNNKFANCGFDGCTVGLLLYDATGQSNNGHGSVIGSSFNHCTDKGIKCINITHGFIIDACNIFYGGISISGSKAMILSNCLIRGGSGTPIEISNNELTIFNTCVFAEEPTWNIDSESLLKKINCFIKDGTDIS